MKIFIIPASLLLIITIFAACKKASLYVEREKPLAIINANSTRLSDSVIHFYSDTVYLIATNLVRGANQRLLIDAGTLLRINDQIGIDINEGGRIEINGTSENPVILTSAALKGQQGYSNGSEINAWNGLTINGNSNGSVTAILKYLRIEFAGSARSSLTLNKLTQNDILENIQVSYSNSGSSFEFSGGNVQGKKLVSYASSLNDFQLRGGYEGTLQYLLAYRHPYFGRPSGAGGNLAGLLISDQLTFPKISNMTIIGPDNRTGTTTTYRDSISRGLFGSLNGTRAAAIVIYNQAKFRIRNSVAFGFPRAGFYLDNYQTAFSLVTGDSEFAYSTIHSNDSSRVFYLPPNVYPGYGSDDFRSFALQSQYKNEVFDSSDDFRLTDPFNYDQYPDPLPASDSPLLDGANFESTFFNDPTLFETVNFRGASGRENWMRGWTNFLPLQTDYNK